MCRSDGRCSDYIGYIRGASKWNMTCSGEYCWKTFSCKHAYLLRARNWEFVHPRWGANNSSCCWHRLDFSTYLPFWGISRRMLSTVKPRCSSVGCVWSLFFLGQERKTILSVLSRYKYQDRRARRLCAACAQAQRFLLSAAQLLCFAKQEIPWCLVFRITAKEGFRHPDGQ